MPLTRDTAPFLERIEVDVTAFSNTVFGNYH